VRQSTIVIDFSEPLRGDLRRLVGAAEAAIAAFEMLLPENHSKTTDAELSQLINSAHESVEEALQPFRSAAARGEKS
jgi:hypothetical protein